MQTSTTAWPGLPPPTWSETLPTLHMWTQVVGKVALALMPRTNHFWNVAFPITPRGLSTYPMPHGDRTFTMAFDFISHELVITCSDGADRIIPLRPMTVADFYAQTMSALHSLGIDVHISTLPTEVPNPIRFEADTGHHSYDPVAANAFWQILNHIKPCFEQFRAKFIGKASPVHFFWGAFDVAVTRFSGRRAPERPGADSITREAYSHEVISHGFWPGMGSAPEPIFYGYAAPVPDGFEKATVGPEGAYWDTGFREFMLPYRAAIASPSPEVALTKFMDDTYAAAAALLHWDRAALERDGR